MASEPPAGPEHEPATETARVAHSRGYTMSTFVLTAADGARYESAPFRWVRAAPPVDQGEPRAAYDALVDQLVADGWTLVEAGPTWYETSFTRPAPLLPDSSAEAVDPAEPEPPPPRRRKLPHLRWAVLAAIGVAAVGAAAGALLLTGGHKARASPERPRRTVTAAVAPQPKTKPKTKPQAPKGQTPKRQAPTRRVAARLVDVRIVAVRGSGSWIEARRRSPTGKLLYSGVLATGHRLHLRGRTVWARFGAASNLSITVDGHPVTLFGTYDKTFRSHR
jgi:hypothetical protein